MFRNRLIKRAEAYFVLIFLLRFFIKGKNEERISVFSSMKYLISTIFLLLFVIVQPCFGQKAMKPQVIVYGSDLLAFSAAVQSARSSVPTIWIVNGNELIPEFSQKQVSLENFLHEDGGIWMELLMEMALSPAENDSLAAIVRKDINPRLFQNAVEKVLRKLPQLTIMKGQDIISLKRRKRDWEIILSNKHTHVVRCVVDASREQKLSHLFDLGWDNKVESLQPLPDLSVTQLRTVIGAGAVGGTFYAAKLSNILVGEKDGFFNFRGLLEVLNADQQESSFRASIGQAVGATAAYLAFFKTTADKLDVRKLQSELLTYKSRILPYQDVAINDRHFYALLRFGLAGVIKDLHVQDTLFFGKDERVRFDDVEPIFDRLYSRSQLWFLDNEGEYFQWKDFLSLIKFVGLRGDDINQYVEKEWAGKLGFIGRFNPEALVTRYQFAAILDQFANPYIKAVNQEGEFIN